MKEESRRLGLSGGARKAQIAQGHIDHQSLLLPATKEQGQEWECLPSAGSGVGMSPLLWQSLTSWLRLPLLPFHPVCLKGAPSGTVSPPLTPRPDALVAD